MSNPLEIGESESSRLGWYRRMVLIRSFEDRVHELFLQGLIPGTTHLCQGQEAVAVGAVSALGPIDVMTCTYRGHGQALARGLDVKAALAELLGRATGCCRGIGGSMHLADMNIGLLGSFAIVGAGIPVALGAAMSFMYRGEDRVAMTFFGDGATNIGTFHESLNMAAVWHAPLVLVIENNLYGEYSSIKTTTPIADLAIRGASYGIPSTVVDGQDVEAVHAVAVEAVQRARAGGGPTLIEAKTYRYRGHSRTDPGRYRPSEELELWKNRDPLGILGDRLTAEGILSVADREEINRVVRSEIDVLAEEAAAAEFPTTDVLEGLVYAS